MRNTYVIASGVTLSIFPCDNQAYQFFKRLVYKKDYIEKR